MKKLHFMLIILLFMGCNDKSANKKNNGEVQKLTSEVHQVKDKSLISSLSDTEISKLEKLSNANISLLYVNNGLLGFSSNSDLTYCTLGCNMSVDKVQQRFGNIFNVEQQEIHDQHLDENHVINKIRFKDSFFKLYFNQEKKKYDLVSGILQNNGIKLPYKIEVGQTKNEFFSNLFEQTEKYNFSVIDTVFNGDEFGNIEQYYIFKDDKLEKVIFKSSYDWIPFDL